MNKKKRVICKFEMGFKKSFCWPSNLSIDYVIYTFVNMYVAFCDLLLVWKWVWILEARCENRCGK